MFNLIFAIDQDGLVGSTSAKFGIPWHYPEDLKFYKKMTTGKNCIMGRSTYQAIGCALPNRNTLVVTRDKDLSLNDAKVIHDLTSLDASQEWWICGGVNVFEQMFDKADTIYITRIAASHKGDVYFNNIDMTGFHLVSTTVGENPILNFEKWEKNEN